MSDDGSTVTSGKDQKLLDRYATFRAGASLANATPGLATWGSRASSIADRIARNHAGIDFSGVTVPEYGSWDTMGTGYNEQGMQGLNRTAARTFRNQGGDFDQRMAGFRAQTGKAVEGAIQKGAQDQMLPSLNAAQQRADSLAGTAAVSATDEAAMRSRISAMVRSAEATRTARIGAQLGLANMQNSPAAAALAQESANQADSALVSTLRDMGLQVNELNRTQARQDIDLASRIAAAKAAVMTGNPATLASMQGDVTAMLDALYSRNQTMDMMEKQIAEAGKQSLSDRLSQWTSVANGIVGFGAGVAGGMGGMGGGGGSFGSGYTGGAGMSPSGSYMGVSPYQSPASPFAAPAW